MTMTDDITPAPKMKHEPVSDSTAMAVDRTMMAADRSLMAWVRTGLALISFGFTIYKFLEYTSAQLAASGKTIIAASGPRAIGLFMIGVGLLSLVLGTLENVATARGLRGRYDITRPRYSLIMAVIVMVFGLVLFIGIALRLSGIGTP